MPFEYTFNQTRMELKLKIDTVLYPCFFIF